MTAAKTSASTDQIRHMLSRPDNDAADPTRPVLLRHSALGQSVLLWTASMIGASANEEESGGGFHSCRGVEAWPTWPAAQSRTTDQTYHVAGRPFCWPARCAGLLSRPSVCWQERRWRGEQRSKQQAKARSPVMSGHRHQKRRKCAITLQQPSLQGVGGGCRLLSSSLNIGSSGRGSPARPPPQRGLTRSPRRRPRRRASPPA